MTARSTLLVLLPLLLLVACGPSNAPQSGNHAAHAAADPNVPPSGGAGADGAIGVDVRPAAPPVRVPIAVTTTLAEWRKADNRSSCAPLLLTDDAGAHGAPRHANIGGGWGVAFDLPDLRSAYGVAGTGVEITNAGEWAERIHKQWPFIRPIGGRNGGLPGESLAGYGRDGAQPFTAANPTGQGERLGAYVVIPGQNCLYNLWSRLGRAQLETMIDHLSLRTSG